VETEAVEKSKMNAHILITGFVQGVGFRQFVKQQAEQLHLTGWVRNLPDGSVETVAKGSQESIEKFIEHCKKGPFLSDVEYVNITWKDDEKSFEEFTIIHE